MTGRQIASRVGTVILVIGFVLVLEDWDRDFGWQITYVTRWVGLGLLILGASLKLPTWVNQ